MRILHTSDWHVGRSLGQVSRLDESRAVLQEICSIAEAEKVDAVIVCGDIFEHLAPSADAEQVVYETLARLSDLEICVIVVTGNHDHPGRWRALAPLLKRWNVFVAETLLLPGEGGMVEVPAKDGSAPLQVALIPWVSERRAYTAADLMGPTEQTYSTYAQVMANSIKAVCDGFEPDKCHVLAGHFFLSGSKVSGTERELTIGQVYALLPHAIPATVQYAALGHNHKPQEGPGVAVPCWYSGSPLQMDFGEIGQVKSVCIVDLKPNMPASVRQIPLSTGRQLRELVGTLDSIRQERNDSQNTWLRILVNTDGPQPGLSDQIREEFPNALIVKVDYPRERPEQSHDIHASGPQELFGAYMTGRYKTEPQTDLMEVFDELVNEVWFQDRPLEGQLELGLESRDGVESQTEEAAPTLSIVPSPQESEPELTPEPV